MCFCSHYPLNSIRNQRQHAGPAMAYHQNKDIAPLTGEILNSPVLTTLPPFLYPISFKSIYVQIGKKLESLLPTQFCEFTRTSTIFMQTIIVVSIKAGSVPRNLYKSLMQAREVFKTANYLLGF